MSAWHTIGCTRSIFETCSNPTCYCIRKLCEKEQSEDLPEENELGSKEVLLYALGACARLCYGTGLYDKEGSDWGHLDPPLEGEGWVVVDQICEAMNSEETVQAGCYVPEARQAKIAIIAFRGTCTRKGILQDIAVGLPLYRRQLKHAIKEACSYISKCRAHLPLHHIYVTGHSLGGFIAEAAASFMGADGAVFNSPGPKAVAPWKKLVGSHRPAFEVHLTRDDPLAMLFPKPDSHKHISRVVHWHEGHDHKICSPYVRHIQALKWRTNRLPIPDHVQIVNQVEDLEAMYPPPEEISDTESEDSSDESSH
ncbi:Serine/threonine-protein kinase 36 [Durusdinium trenchii]|uniref:Serine/threonine-protein kinase 36 n=1 Tax=Durusdinium trenchii TaxID=1381693 RepID=A0ABP0I2Q6_9DINO